MMDTNKIFEDVIREQIKSKFGVLTKQLKEPKKCKSADLNQNGAIADKDVIVGC